MLPLVLLIGVSAAFEAKCRSVASKAKLLVRSCGVPFARPEALATRPLAIVVHEALYDLAPRGFDLLAEDVDGVIVRLDTEEIAPVVLEYRLMGAVLAAAKLR